jgi:hypothetical protein
MTMDRLWLVEEKLTQEQAFEYDKILSATRARWKFPVSVTTPKVAPQPLFLPEMLN